MRIAWLLGLLLAAPLLAAPLPTYGQAVQGAIYIADTGNHRVVRINDISGAGWVTLGGQVGFRQFQDARGLFVDAGGRIYVADAGNHRIVRIDEKAGSNWIAFGKPGRGRGQFDSPSGIAVDGAGYIYVADTGNNRIVRLDDMAGNGWTTLGTAGIGVNQFFEPLHIFAGSDGRIYIVASTRSTITMPDGEEGFIHWANTRVVRIDDMTGSGWTEMRLTGDDPHHVFSIFIDSMGRIYFADSDCNCIVRLDGITGTGRVTYGTMGMGMGQFMNPTDIFVDSTGRIYVADSGRLVRMDDMSGAGWTTMPIDTMRRTSVSEGRGYPADVSVDQTGRIFVLSMDRVVRVDDMTGAGRAVFGGRVRSGVRQFDAPVGIFVDAAGRIYVTDPGNDRVVRMDDMTGRGWVSLGGTEGCCGPGQFAGPDGIALDARGRIYIADSANKWIVRMDDMSGKGWTTLRSTGADQFSRPMGIAVDERGRIYVAESGPIFEIFGADTTESRVVRVDDMTGAGWSVIGTSGPLAKRFGSLAGIAVDRSGRIYVADLFGQIVRFADMDGSGWFATWFWRGWRGEKEVRLRGGCVDGLGPIGIALDGAGRIYVTDWTDSQIARMDSLGGTGLTCFGGLGRGVGQFDFPTGIFVR